MYVAYIVVCKELAIGTQGYLYTTVGPDLSCFVGKNVEQEFAVVRLPEIA